MIPKTIHLCWFSGDTYPVEIKICLESWERILPDYKVKVWTAADARAIGIPYINEALEERRWAFASDVVRFYALWSEGGVYMDSDILLFRRFDEILPKDGECVTFNECVAAGETDFGLQAAFLIADKGNEFCRRMLDYYSARHYRMADGSFDNTISPITMRETAKELGYRQGLDTLQEMPGLTVYPTRMFAPRKRYHIEKDTVGQHRVYGSWRKRKLSRRIEKSLEHYSNVVKYHIRKKFRRLARK